MKKVFSMLFFAVLFCFMVIPTSYASVEFADVSELPVFDSDHSDYKDYPYTHYVIHKTFGSQYNANIIFFGSEQPFLVNSYIDSHQDAYSAITYTVEDSDSEVHMYQYNLISSGKWVIASSTPQVFQDGYTTRKQVAKLYYSTFNIRQSESSDEVFFSPPTELELYQIIQEVTKEAITKEKLTLDGTMKILTVCGIGLIALLIGLVLFGKVLRPYLPR